MNRKRILLFVLGALVAGGSASLVVLAVSFARTPFFEADPDARDRTDEASADDVRFVLEECRLGDERIERVVHSFESARLWPSRDHLDAYAIQLTGMKLEDLTKLADNGEVRWQRGDQVAGDAHSAIDWIANCMKVPSWFPREAELRSADVYVCPVEVGRTSVFVIFARLSDRMIFYFECKT